MRKNIGYVLILGVSTLNLSGCLFHRDPGPCYGVGCSSFTQSGTQKTAVVPQPATAPAAGATSTVAETSQGGPTQTEASQSDATQAKPGKFSRMLSALHLHQ
jgi:hypothetical protein